MENSHFLAFLKRYKRVVLLGLAGLVTSLSLFIAPFSWAQSTTKTTSTTLAMQEWTEGQVVKLDVERAKITLKHEAIKSIKMDAMTMPFKVSEVAMLQGLAVGDKVIFQVEQTDSGLVISTLKAKP